ncbi:Uncharacterized protein TPAR_02531 [Tolypocladium paradoxum]|uniref:RBR-type E3 ubiquitin transferase n=1 Tax=Tolypocladium paradoxum TaxID=94208 RepID=A0A2S4L4B0_9HYPO|nr:Uncharacterized protein TPAR_02531 [Tolypocladium paradoxum]
MTERNIDDASLRLMLQLHLEDLEDLERNKKGKQPEGEMSDFDLAMNMYKDSLETFATQHHDRRMCISIARAVVSDAPVIQACSNEEERATQDRAMAMSFNHNSGTASNRLFPNAGTANRDQSGSLNEELFRKLGNLNLFSDGAEVDTYGESSTWAATRDPARGADGEKIETEACISCGDEHLSSSLAKAPCSHNYCSECINSLFKSASVDESLFPPRCCSMPIPVDDNLELLSTENVGVFRAKQIEFSTADRTYCHHPGCSTFVPPQFIKGDLATCVKCSAKTCVTCKGAQHEADNCPKDSTLQEVLRVAKENGWQQCKSCSRLVELSSGCYHMTHPACLCRAQFCYLCGERWKTCRCPQWEERHLLSRAENIVNRDCRNTQLGTRRRAELVRRAAADLRQNHECLHTRWTSRGGAHQCEECHDNLPNYIYECCQCRIMACRRCRFNRL